MNGLTLNEIAVICIIAGVLIYLMVIVCVPRTESRIVQASKPVHLPKPKKYLDVSDLDDDDIANLEFQRDFFKGKK